MEDMTVILGLTQQGDPRHPTDPFHEQIPQDQTQ